MVRVCGSGGGGRVWEGRWCVRVWANEVVQK